MNTNLINESIFDERENINYKNINEMAISYIIHTIEKKSFSFMLTFLYGNENVFDKINYAR